MFSMIWSLFRGSLTRHNSNNSDVIFASYNWNTNNHNSSADACDYSNLNYCKNNTHNTHTSGNNNSSCFILHWNKSVQKQNSNICNSRYTQDSLTGFHYMSSAVTISTPFMETMLAESSSTIKDTTVLSSTSLTLNTTTCPSTVSPEGIISGKELQYHFVFVFFTITALVKCGIFNNVSVL